MIYIFHVSSIIWFFHVCFRGCKSVGENLCARMRNGIVLNALSTRDAAIQLHFVLKCFLKDSFFFSLKPWSIRLALYLQGPHSTDSLYSLLVAHMHDHRIPCVDAGRMQMFTPGQAGDRFHWATSLSVHSFAFILGVVLRSTGSCFYVNLSTYFLFYVSSLCFVYMRERQYSLFVCAWAWVFACVSEKERRIFTSQ